MAFHEKAGRSQVDPSLAWLNKVCFSRRVATVALASIRTLEERFISLGACLAFSFQPVLPSVWRPVVVLFSSGTWARPLTQSPKLGFGFCLFPSWNGFDLCFCLVLRGCRHRRSTAVVQRFVRFSAYPQMMQQDRQLSCRSNDRSFLPVPPTALRWTAARTLSHFDSSSRKVNAPHRIVLSAKSFPIIFSSTVWRLLSTPDTTKVPSCPRAVTRSPILGIRFLRLAMPTVSHTVGQLGYPLFKRQSVKQCVSLVIVPLQGCNC